MFNALLQDDNKPSPKKIITSTTSLVATNRMQRALARLQMSLFILKQATESYNDLRLFRDILKTDGASPQLIKFVNANNRLSKIIASFPALENMDMTGLRSNDSRVLKTVEEINQVLDIEPSTISDYSNDTTAHLDEMFEGMKEQLAAVNSNTNELTEALQNGVPSGVFESISARCLSAESLHHMIENLTHVVIEIDNPAREKLEDIHEMVGHISACTGIHVDNSGEVELDRNLISEEYRPAEKTLAEHGYTAEELVALIHHAQTLVDELLEIAEKHHDVINSRYKSKDVDSDQSETPVTPGSESNLADIIRDNDVGVGGSSGDQGGQDAVGISEEEDEEDGDDDDDDLNGSDGEDREETTNHSRKMVGGYSALLITVTENSINVVNDILEIANDVVSAAGQSDGDDDDTEVSISE